MQSNKKESIAEKLMENKIISSIVLFSSFTFVCVEEYVKQKFKPKMKSKAQ